VLSAAFGAFGQLDSENAAVYFQSIWNMLREPMQQALEVLVMERQTSNALRKHSKRPMSSTEPPAHPLPTTSRGSRAQPFLRAIAWHRMTHFLVLGAILYAIAPAPKETRQIRVDPDVLAALRAEEAKKLGKQALSADEMRLVEARAIEDELLYREALRLRIAEGDLIIRQRLVQKLLVLAEDIAGASEPLRNDALQDCFSQTKDQWKLPAAIQFVHVVGSSRDTLAGLRDQVVAFTADPAHENEIPPFGESFATHRRVTGTLADVAHAFGSDFAAAISILPPRQWSEPIASKYGLHLVRVLSFNQEKPATLEDVRGKLTVDCQLRRREEAIRRYVGRLFKEYEVYVGSERVRDFSPTNRTAPRGEMSGEDG
jgi:PPIC-type PPIASE domain